MEKNLVCEWMTPNPITINPKTTLDEAHRLLKERRIRRLPVIDHRGHVVGIVTLGDVREAEPSDAISLSIFELHYLLAKLTVAEIMTREPITVSPDTTLRDSARIMLEHKIGGLPVVENGRLVGIITESDIFRVLAQGPDPSPSEVKEELARFEQATG